MAALALPPTTTTTTTSTTIPTTTITTFSSSSSILSQAPSNNNNNSNNNDLLDPWGNCTELLGHVDWTDGRVATLVILVVINALVLAGNCLVILAVFSSSKLRTVTNLFIVSLAVSDLMLGVGVLPFSMANTVFESWVFAVTWCSIWQAIDVWMSTASILNLVVISLDRYVAVTRPVSYPSRMTRVRAKILIALVWVISFLICLPPLVGWTDKEDTQTVTVEQDCTRTCKLNDNTGYVIYSACGSFFLPMLVMLFFYWKIYCAAAETTKAINQGFRTTKNKKILGSRFQEERLTLRIHRGRNSMQEHNQNNTQKQQNSRSNQRRYNTQRNGHRNNGPQGRSSSMKMKSLRPQLIMKTSLSSSLQPSLNHMAMSDRCDLCHAQCSRNHSPEALSPPPCSSDNDSGGVSNKPHESCFTVVTNYSEVDKTSCQNQLGVELTPPTPSRCSSAPSSAHLPRRFAGKDGEGVEDGSGGGGTGEGEGGGRGGGVGGGSGGGGGTSADSKSNSHLKPFRGRANTTSRMGRRNIKLQVKRFRMETKAAKTLGIIVGVFILCWFPFFTMYLIRGICSQCVIWDLLFDILFWLGYCNSAVNPFIYALFSKDFRYAFKNILCKCVCRRERRLGMPLHQQSIYIPSYDRDNDSDDEDSKR